MWLRSTLIVLTLITALSGCKLAQEGITIKIEGGGPTADEVLKKHDSVFEQGESLALLTFTCPKAPPILTIGSAKIEEDYPELSDLEVLDRDRLEDDPEYRSDVMDALSAMEDLFDEVVEAC